MSKKTKMVNVKTGEVIRVNLHPSKGEIFRGQSISFRNRTLAMKRKGFVHASR